MIPTRLPDAADAFRRGLITHLAAQCVAGVGRINEQSTAPNGLGSALEEPALRIFWMNLEELAHKVMLEGFPSSDPQLR